MTEVTEVVSSSWAHSGCIGKHWGLGGLGVTLGAKILVGIKFCWQFLRRFGRILDSTSPPISQHHCNSVAFHTMSKSKVCFWLGRPYKRIITSIDFSRAPLHILISDCCGEAAKVWFYLIFTSQSFRSWGVLELWNGDLARTTDGSTRVTKSLWQDMAPIRRSMGILGIGVRIEDLVDDQ